MAFRNRVILVFCLFFPMIPGQAQYPVFGDLIPDMFLPPAIRPDMPLDCIQYFHLADSINSKVFAITGVNPIPEYIGGNDSLSRKKASIEDAVKELLPPGSILARMIIDRLGRPICCKVYVRDGTDPGREVANAFSRLLFTPGYRNGKAVPTECRFIYDFQTPKLHGRKIIE